jgi:hypothetical protein
MLKLTRERWAQLAITTQFLIVIRTLGEFFRLKYVLGASFSTEPLPHISGARCSLLAHAGQELRFSSFDVTACASGLLG